jgi:hypothetical protein
MGEDRKVLLLLFVCEMMVISTMIIFNLLLKSQKKFDHTKYRICQ